MLNKIGRKIKKIIGLMFVFSFVFVFLTNSAKAIWTAPVGNPPSDIINKPIYNEEETLSNKDYAMIDRTFTVAGDLDIDGSAVSLGGLNTVGRANFMNNFSMTGDLNAANINVLGELDVANRISATELCNVDESVCRNLSSLWDFSASAETDPTVPVYLKNGVWFHEIIGNLAGFEDRDDDDGDPSFFVDSIGHNILVGHFMNSDRPVEINLDNIGIGSHANNLVTGGDDNISIGVYAGNGIVNSSDNILLGSHSRVSDGVGTSDSNVGVGYSTFLGMDGSNNVAAGYHALSAARGYDNVSIGSGSLNNLWMGDYNVALGYNALDSATVTDHNVAIGYGAGQGTTVDEGFLYLSSSLVNPTLIGGNFEGGFITIEGTIVHWSDARLKKDVKNLSASLEKISKLQGVNFTWKKTDRKDMGLIAQDVEKVYPELVKVNEANPEKYKSIEYGNLLAPIVEAIKEQQVELENQAEEVKLLQERIRILKNKIDN